jgi:hypothetical protein
MMVLKTPGVFNAWEETLRVPENLLIFRAAHCPEVLFLPPLSGLTEETRFRRSGRRKRSKPGTF